MSFRPVDAGDLVGHPGSSREIDVRGGVDLVTEVASVLDDVRGVLRLEGLVDEILVSGSLSGRFALGCARCLVGFERSFTLDVHELYVERPDPDGNEYRLGAEGTVELEPMVRDAVGLAMPFSPLCRPDCLGLCEVCGGDRNRGECPGHDEIDPRWAGLASVLEHLPE